MPAETMAEASSPSNDSAVRDAVMKSKGLSMIDDLDAEEEPLLQLQQHHELVIIVELCEATRPSKLGSLKGSHAKYEEEFSRLEGELSAALAGDGSIRMEKWAPGMQNAVPQNLGPPLPPSSSSRPSRPQSAGASRMSSRPQSAASRPSAGLRAMGLADGSERSGPRIGAFEVSYKLVNTTSGRQYGPVEIFSKIQTGRWPGAGSLLVKRVQERLQGFLAADVGAGMLFQHVSIALGRARGGGVGTARARGPLARALSPLAILPSRARARASHADCMPSQRPPPLPSWLRL